MFLDQKLNPDSRKAGLELLSLLVAARGLQKVHNVSGQRKMSL